MEEEQVTADTPRTTEYTAEDIRDKMKPLSENGFERFFQKIVRWWLGVWYTFADRKPKLSALVYKIVFFMIFSVGVTLWQFIIMAIVPQFLPKTGPVGWPMVPIKAAGGNNFIIFGDEQGWTNFIFFEVAVFTAQCINFPLQRNVTYRSHGNPYWQAMWYFIGWVFVSLGTNAVWGLCNAFLLHWGVPGIVIGIFKTLLTGVVSLIIFFFIFLVIFPDNNKLAKRWRAKYEKLQQKNALPERIAKVKAKFDYWEERAAAYNAELELFKAQSQANAAAIKYFALVKAEERATDDKKAEYAARVEKSFSEAVEAIKKLETITAVNGGEQ